MQHTNSTTRHKKSFRQEVYRKLGLGVTCFISALCLAYLMPAVQTGDIESPLRLTVPAGSDNTTEFAPTQTVYDAYRVAPDAPRYLKIPKLTVQSRILGVGLTATKAIDAPRSIHDAGWYTGSTKPGKVGVTFIDGHVSGVSQPGIFKQLGMLAPGDTVEIETGDGAIERYHVYRVRSVPDRDIDMQQLLTSTGGEERSLVLMTCGGRFDRAQNKYVDRVIVSATHIET